MIVYSVTVIFHDDESFYTSVFDSEEKAFEEFKDAVNDAIDNLNLMAPELGTPIIDDIPDKFISHYTWGGYIPFEGNSWQINMEEHIL